jgi:hypothetical protein
VENPVETVKNPENIRGYGGSNIVMGKITQQHFPEKQNI